jgi:hypothetical protein
MPKHNKLPIGRYGISKKMVVRNVWPRIGKYLFSIFFKPMLQYILCLDNNNNSSTQNNEIDYNDSDDANFKFPHINSNDSDSSHSVSDISVSDLLEEDMSQSVTKKDFSWLTC